TGRPARDRGEPAPGRAADQRQGRARAPGAAGRGSSALAAALPGFGAPGAGGFARLAGAVPHSRRRAADPAAVLDAGEAARRRGGHRPGADQPARAAPQLRHPPAQPRRRPAHPADAAGPQLALDHPDLHPGGARAAQAPAPAAPSTRVSGGHGRARRRPVRATMPHMKTLLFLALAGFSLGACAGDAGAPAAAQAGAKPTAAAGAATAAAGTPAARARAALHTLDPDMPIERIDDAAFPGFQAAIVSGQVVYVSNDGKYLIQGSAYDIAARKDLGEEAMKSLRVELMRDMPLKDRIVFAPKDPKYTVTVFTDVECGYCRKLHSEIDKINAQGIAVQYVAFPRMGRGSEDCRKMVAVWCSANPKQALTDAKNDRPVPYRECTNPVAMQYKLGQRMGLTGTPLVLAPDGTALGGYLPPDRLRAALDKLAEGETPVASTATGSP